MLIQRYLILANYYRVPNKKLQKEMFSLPYYILFFFFFFKEIGTNIFPASETTMPLSVSLGI